MDIDTNGRGIAQIDNSEPPTCECCGDEYTMDTGDEPTPFCDSCAHNVLEKRTAELADLRARLTTAERELAEARAVVTSAHRIIGRDSHGYAGDAACLVSSLIDVMEASRANSAAEAEATERAEQADTTRREWEVRAAKSCKEADALRGERHDLTNEVMTLKSLLHVALRTTGQLPPGKDLPTDKTARTRLLNTLILDALPLLLDERYRTAHATGRAAGLLEAAAKLAELRDEWEVMMGDGSVAHNCGKIAHGHVIALAPPAAEPRDEGEVSDG